MPSTATTALVVLSAIACSRAEDASRPHTHAGTFKRYNPGPPKSAGLALSAVARRRLEEEGSKPECTVIAIPAGPTSPRGTMRCTSTQLVHAPSSVVWETLLDYPNYPKFVGGITSCKPYSKRPTITGGQVVCAKYVVAVGPYKVRYFVEHKYEPLQKAMVWSLDYTRLSDIYDSVGYWHVEPQGANSIVYYTQDSLLPAWIPAPIKKTFTKVAMKAATSKLEPACFETMRRKSEKRGGLRLRLPSADALLNRFKK